MINPFLYIILICLVLFNLYTGHLGYIFIDISRELYLPSAVNDGGVLYKDIFNVYAPLGYQLNAFITSVFGNSLKVFYAIGLVNSILAACALYLISRLFFKGQTALSISVFTITACIFNNYASNYILPYSYSMVYALNAFLWALLALLYYVKENKRKYLYLSFLAAGASIAFKYDFSLFIFVLLYFFFKNTNLKDKFICAASFAFIPFISALDLYIKGVSLNDIQNALHYMRLLTEAESVKHLYTFLGFIPSAAYMQILVKNFFYAVSALGILLFYKLLLPKMHNILRIIVFLCISAGFLKAADTHSVFIFSWIGLAAAAGLVVLPLLGEGRGEGSASHSVHGCIIILALSCTLAGIKSIFNISFNTYGNYYMPLFLICLAVFILYQLPEKLRDKAEEGIKQLFYFLAVIFLFVNYNNMLKYHDAAIISNKGVLYTESRYAPVVQSVHDYIKKNISEDKTLLVIPDGALINYLTDRKSNNKLYYLTPPNTEIFTQKQIIEDLKADSPDYILITPIQYGDYGTLSFCRDFGADVCGFIKENYELEKYFQDDKSGFNMSLYKLQAAKNRL